MVENLIDDELFFFHHLKVSHRYHLILVSVFDFVLVVAKQTIFCNNLCNIFFFNIFYLSITKHVEYNYIYHTLTNCNSISDGCDDIEEVCVDCDSLS